MDSLETSHQQLQQIQVLILSVILSLLLQHLAQTSPNSTNSMTHSETFQDLQTKAAAILITYFNIFLGKWYVLNLFLNNTEIK